MAVLVIAHVPGGSAEQDDKIRERLNFAVNPPKGLLMRVAGPVQDGWRVVSVWDSKEDFEAFNRDQLQSALQQAGVQQPTFEVAPLTRVRIAQPQH